MDHPTNLGSEQSEGSASRSRGHDLGRASRAGSVSPGELAYGGADGYEEEKRALEASLDASVDLFDTAAFYSGGASELRVGELAQGKDVLIASKFPSGIRFKADDFPRRAGGEPEQAGTLPLSTSTSTISRDGCRYRT